jgi:hypothetical protein
MTPHDPENGTTRDELVQRIALMETMIAEGRQSTARFGWIFVLWGVVELAGIAWEVTQPQSNWVWPITIAGGFVLQFLGFVLRRRRGIVCSMNLKSRSVSAVWSMMGLAATLYSFTAIFRHEAWQVSFFVGIFMLVGLAHATSAMILRWAAQGFVAAIWWAGGLAAFFVRREYDTTIFVVEMVFGMIGFGLYAMWLERRRLMIPVQDHV